MIDLDRFWMEGDGPYEDWPGGEALPGVSEEELRAWEQEHGVTMPEPIRSALGRRNGGFVRNAPIMVESLDRIVPVDDEFWEFTEIDEGEAPDRALMFVFGMETEVGGTLLMNFNARGPGGPPSVYIDHHGESSYRIDGSIGGFFEATLVSSEAPGVDWSEAEAAREVLARETIDLSSLHGGRPASLEQVLARDEGSLILFTRERSPDGESLSRTTLPLPLDPQWARLRAYRPVPGGTFALHLQPEESEGIVCRESRTDADGRWKDSTAHGVPIYVSFESTDRGRLEALRARVLGDAGAARATAEEDRQAELSATLDALAPEQRTAAMIQAALKMKEEMDRKFAAQHGDLGPPPPELAGLAEAMRQRLETMAEQARQKAAANPPDPETLRRIEELLRGPESP